MVFSAERVIIANTGAKEYGIRSQHGRILVTKFLRLLVSSLLLVAASAAAEPLRIIFDTDMGNDVDDALALAVIHALQSRGECELLAVTISKDHEECAPYVDAVNTFYGRGDIPIGAVRDGATRQKSKFTGVAQQAESGERVYPHDLELGDRVPDAVDVLRRVLAAQPDDSVAVIQVGFSTNLARLLQSPKDDVSPLTGSELVKEKVKVLSIMAGAFDLINGKVHREYNVILDIPSARELAAQWPTPVVWSGFEIGLAIRYPALSIDRDFAYVKRHPIPESYQVYMPTPHERPTWDLTSVLWAVRPDHGYFGLSEPGAVHVDEKGITTFEKKKSGLHRYLTADDVQVARTREVLAALASQPPD